MKILKNIILGLSIILYIISFRTIKTKSLKRRSAAYLKERWEGKRKCMMQELLDEEHSRGYGVVYLTGKVKRYEPYTALSLRNS